MIDVSFLNNQAETGNGGTIFSDVVPEHNVVIHVKNIQVDPYEKTESFHHNKGTIDGPIRISDYIGTKESHGADGSSCPSSTTLCAIEGNIVMSIDTFSCTIPSPLWFASFGSRSFIAASDCQMTATIDMNALYGVYLSIVGSGKTNGDELTVLTAKAGARHIYVGGGNEIFLKLLKLVGGSAAAGHGVGLKNCSLTLTQLLLTRTNFSFFLFKHRYLLYRHLLYAIVILFRHLL